MGSNPPLCILVCQASYKHNWSVFGGGKPDREGDTVCLYTVQVMGTSLSARVLVGRSTTKALRPKVGLHDMDTILCICG